MTSPTDARPDGLPPPAETAEIRRLRAEHAAAIQALQSAIRDTTRLTRLFSILSEPGPPERLLDRVLATLSELFMSDIVVLLEASPPRGFVPIAAIGLPGDLARQPIPATADDYATAALAARVPIIAAAVPADPRTHAVLRELGAETAVWLAVVGDQDARGVLVLARCRPTPFARADVDLLAAMAYRIGLMLDRAHGERERQQVETKLRRAEKAESLGRMAGAIAHHFNNMLAVVVSCLDMTLEDLAANAPHREDLVSAREAAERAAKTSRLMLAYLGQSAGKRVPLNFVEVLQDALAPLQSALPAHIRLTADWREPDLVVVANATQLSDVLAHLLANAREALGHQPGSIRLAVFSASAAEIPASQPSLTDSPPGAGAYACLEVADDGCGMAADTLEKIFDPFFTTKFVGRGLGLPVTLGTVRAHEGFIGVQSAPGQGTTFRIFLPLADRALPAPRKPAPAPAAHGLVLVADDEDIVCRTLQHALGKLGYEVLAAGDGREAVARFREHPDAIRLVVFDLTMPVMDGWDALEAVRRLRPGLPAVLASGYDEAQALGDRPPDAHTVFLRKPYAIAELRAAIAKALG